MSMPTTPHQSSCVLDANRNQDEHRHYEKRLRDFAEAGSDWFFEMDAELQFTYVSERHQEVIGVAPEQIIGKTRWDAHKHRRLPEEEDKWRKHMATMQAHRSWRDFTYTLIRDDGERRVISNSAKAIFDNDGAFAGYRGVGRDITEKAKSEAQLQSILNVVPDAIITIDEQGLIASFSPAAEKIFGYTATEIVGHNVKMLMPTPYQQEHDGYLTHYKNTGEKRIIGIGRQVEARRKDGSIFPINLAINEMIVEGRRLFTGVMQDISELRQAQSLSERLGHILDRSLNEIYVFDAETLRFVQANYGARQNMGYSSAEMLQLTPVDIKPEYTEEQFEAVIEPLRNATKKVLIFETRHQRKDGTTYPVEVHLQLMRTDTPPVFVAIIKDITEAQNREAMLRQSQKMEAIGQLTGGIAHDFNNLLTVILGNNELLEHGIGDNARLRKFLTASSAAAQRGSQLTGQLLSFARQQPLKLEIIDINSLVQDMVDMLDRALGETIELCVVLAPDLRKTVTDPTQLHNALLNLAINARDAMPNGGKLMIETSNADLDTDAAKLRPGAEPGQYVRLSIRDTGNGMPSDVQARAFEPFFTTKERGKGTGLGLSMVHGFAKQSGGHLDLYSEFGHGTAISLYLPDANETEHQHPQQSDPPPPDSDASGETVLVVEDDASVREITVARLGNLGYEIIEAEVGQQALELLEQGAAVDVLLTDMIMPGGMTGAELVRTVRAKYPHIRAVLSSGYAAAGMMPTDGTPWLRKPYTLLELHRTLRQVLDK
jgi:PAS domain S-box-containing protein